MVAKSKPLPPLRRITIAAPPPPSFVEAPPNPVVVHRHVYPLRLYLAMLAGTVLLVAFLEGAQWIARTDPSIPATDSYGDEVDEPYEVASDEALAIAREDWHLHQTEVALKLPTVTPTPLPTNTPTPDANRLGDFCTGTPAPGAICKKPPPPPPTPTPYPSCARLDELAPGAWCIWPTPPPIGGVWE